MLWQVITVSVAWRNHFSENAGPTFEIWYRLSTSSSLVPSAAIPYQQVNNSSSFRSLVICFATAPVSICVNFMQPYWYLFTALESGNMSQNSLAAWSAVLKGRLCSTRKSEKSSSAFTTFWLKFTVAEIGPKSVSFLCRYAASTHPLCFEVYLCLLIPFSPPSHMQYWSRSYTQYIT